MKPKVAGAPRKATLRRHSPAWPRTVSRGSGCTRPYGTVCAKSANLRQSPWRRLLTAANCSLCSSSTSHPHNTFTAHSLYTYRPLTTRDTPAAAYCFTISQVQHCESDTLAWSALHLFNSSLQPSSTRTKRIGFSWEELGSSSSSWGSLHYRLIAPGDPHCITRRALGRRFHDLGMAWSTTCNTTLENQTGLYKWRKE